MTNSKHKIAWLTRRQVKFESQKFERFGKLLSQIGYQIQWIEVPAQIMPDKFSEWLPNQLPQNLVGIFFSDKEASWFRPLIHQIRTSSGDYYRFLPVFWIFDDTDHHLLGSLFDAGFNDFFEESIRPHELLLRLKLRISEAQELKLKDCKLVEEKDKTAQTEIALKQREEFLGVCAHDLRSPLGLIQSAVTIVLKDHSGKGTLTSSHHELLSRAKRQASHAVSLVNDLLDVMSFEQGFQPQYQLINLHELLHQFHQDYGPKAAEKNVHFHYDNPLPDWRVLADADRLQQMLQNLFLNALKFTESGKNIYLSVNPFHGRRKTDPPYPMVAIALKDEGKGIPPREMQKLFDRFSQIKSHSLPEGRGLGLTVAKQISLLHEGNIWAESAEGQGSTFWALLPHVISRAEVTEHRKNKGDILRILIMEPSDEKRELFFKELSNWGVEVHYASNGVDGIAMMFHLIPDLVVLTPKIEKMRINEIIKLMKSDPITHTIPVVLMATEEEKVEVTLDMHQYDRVLKLPFNKDQFDLLLRSVGLSLDLPTPMKQAA